MRTVTGTGYSLFYDDEGRYVFGSGVANPTVRSAQGATGEVIPSGAFFYRNDLGYGLYNVAGTWTVLSATQGATTVTSLAASGAITGDTLTLVGGVTTGSSVAVKGTNTTGFVSIGVNESGTLTADAGGSATLSYTNGLPARSIILGVIVKTVTTFTGSSVAKFAVGDGSTSTRFRSTPAAGITANNVAVCLDHLSGTVAFTQAAAADVVVTFYRADGTTPSSPTAGALRISVIYATLTESGTISSFV